MRINWSNEEIEFLKEHSENKTLKELHSFFPKRTKRSLEHKVYNLGLPFINSQLWKKEDEQFLKDNYTNLKLDRNFFETNLCKNWWAIVSKANKLGITR